MKYALLYESPDALDEGLLRELFPAHQARWSEFAEAGTLLMIGPYADRSGALAVFTNKEAATAFALDDPFVTNGLVARWQVIEWMEALVPEV